MIVLRLLFFAILLVPILEFALLWRITTEIGLVWSLVWNGGTFLLGLVCARGLRGRMLERLRDAALERRDGSREGVSEFRRLTQAAAYGFGGLLLILPGPITDVLGVVVILPIARHAVLGLVQRWSLAAAERVVTVQTQNFYESTGEPPPEPVEPRDTRPRPSVAPGRIRDVDFEISEE